ncbi:MAG: VWA domain-containing protein [Chitinophagales bacterium]|nr:VWA domain-containing protein [Chitinophagales bacterium]HMV14928.1 VWA domain-containing protein [Chitinophagales bacterium]HMW13677.1 VWA domain-containing protein [Chitinophagales bacterium]HMX60343.1 VWA domain-containing protein [Chitinophagales bacterium]HMY24262.1 VWA domain-containing protein [Chitinophagales bacterium]
MGLELDEIIYSKVLKFIKKRKRNNADLLSRKADLETLKPRLIIMARAICGSPIELFPAEREGAYRDDNFFLPAQCALFPTKALNTQFYIFRTVYLSVQKQLNLNFHNASDVQDTATQKAMETAPLVLEKLFKDFPALEQWYFDFIPHLPLKKDESIDYSMLYGKWMCNTQQQQADTLQHIDEQAKTLQNNIKAKTTLNVKAVESIESLTIDKKQQEDYVLLHSFEKIETAEEFNGNWRDFDGKDDLKDHQEALEEMNMRFTVRVDDTVHSVYQADFIENTTVSESAETDEKGFHLKYDEWDFNARKYKNNYCKVYPKTQLKTNTAYYKQTLTTYNTLLLGLRKMLVNINNRLQQQRKQLYGESFDLDALTDVYTDIHSGVSPDERTYLSKRKKEKDISILLLLDISLSSDSYAAGNRILDVEKMVSILFGEILNEYNIEFAIDGFYSKTRNNTSYLTLKEFSDKWSIAKHRIGAIEPSGYTRIGPALRHAGARMKAKSSAKNKWIIILSDGKPNDYDKYEGQYGIHDIKQALKELNQQGIHSYALAIETQAKYYLPQMFGQNHYQILQSPAALLQAMAKLFEKIKHL